MPKRDPHDVLGVARGASQTAIKAAWRRLARLHHPDVSGTDAAAVRTNTRKMAEINAAYETLRVGAPGSGHDGLDAPARPAVWPPAPRPTRPVTARLDTSPTFKSRNATTSGPRPKVRAPELHRGDRLSREPLRASDPNGPIRSHRNPDFRPAPPPTLDEALDHVMEFGKFHGHTLRAIAAFEPSYIDWLAKTINRDPDLVARARVIQSDFDARGIVRRDRSLA